MRFSPAGAAMRGTEEGDVMTRGPKWKASSVALLVAAATTLIGFELVQPDDVSAQATRRHPKRRPPPPVPSPAPVPAPVPGSGAAVDPGVRAGSVDAGQMIGGLTPGLGSAELFDAGGDAFADINSVLGTIAGEPDAGLGPRFNSNGCGTCHAQPALGGTSPSARHYPFVGPNPQVALASLHGARNRVPSFVTADGPVREARFKFVVRDGQLTNTPDGTVWALYTIEGRSDATGTVGITGAPQTCRLAQPDFDLNRRLNNLALRTPTPVFGAGLIENIADATILANLNANAAAKAALGISGRANRNDKDNTISKFGWKAQGPSLVVFAGEAYNVEQGVTNELFPIERGNVGESLPRECLFNPTPEDRSASDAHGDAVLFASFMRFLAPPTPSATVPGGAASIQRGEQVFGNVGCALCHTPSLPVSPTPFFTGTPVARLFSDLLVHDMGPALGDGISQGAAGPNEFRTAPLWGLGQRIFFLHDGRTTDLVEAIQWHGGRGSEAREVTSRYFGLPEADKQHLLNFLRSL
jgi:CxxC motif-containing protein (DUF1111 family)